MELLESRDPEKIRLLETSERHKRALEEEVSSLTQKTERVLTNALVIGGALALTYLAVSQLTRRSQKRKKKKEVASEHSSAAISHEEEDSGPSLLSQIGETVVSQATVILLDIARQKLAEYMQKRTAQDEPS